MNRGFYTILAAQFFSALADNALLFAAIALLKQVHAPTWETPVLQQAFILSFIVLAPFVGAFADSLPKGRVMFISNTIKMAGCIAMLIGINPLLAYGLAGFGAAAYSPAKYGILTEYLPPERLVWANSWMEGLTVAAIIFGAVTGGMLITPSFAATVMENLHVPPLVTPAELAIFIIFFIYLLAALINLYIPVVPIDHKAISRNPYFLFKDFAHCFMLLWKDPLGQVSLAVTTLFWGAGATLRLLVLSWAAVALHYSIGEAAKLTAWVAVGIAIGAILAARLIKLEHAVKVLPVGIGMGVAVLAMIPVTHPAYCDPAAHQHRNDGRFLRGTDERTVAAPRSPVDGCWSFHRRAKLQREHQHFSHAGTVCTDGKARTFPYPYHLRVWPADGRHHESALQEARARPRYRQDLISL